MSGHTCFSCKTEHGTDNMVAFCATCYVRERENMKLATRIKEQAEIDRLRQQLAAKESELAQAQDKIKMLENDGFRCAQRYVKAEKERDEAKARLNTVSESRDEWSRAAILRQEELTQLQERTTDPSVREAEAALADCVDKLRSEADWEHEEKCELIGSNRHYTHTKRCMELGKFIANLPALARRHAERDAMDRKRLRNQNTGKTHCKYGHALVPENIYITRGERICRRCMRERKRAYDAIMKRRAVWCECGWEGRIKGDYCPKCADPVHSYLSKIAQEPGKEKK